MSWVVLLARLACFFCFYFFVYVEPKSFFWFSGGKISSAAATTALPLLPATKAIQQRCTTPHWARHVSPPFKRGHQASPTCHWEHPLLCMSRQPHCPHGPQHDCKQTSQRHQINDEKMQTAPWLPCHASQCNSTISRFWHDPQHSLRCVYLSKANAHSHSCGHFFMGWQPDALKPIKLNGVFFTLCVIFVLWHRFRSRGQTQCPLPQLQTGHYLLSYTRRNGPPSAPPPINCDNSTAIGIASNTVKRQRSRAMEMRFFWVADAVAQGKFDIKYFPGKENLADYQSKHHTGAHDVAVRPWYLHEPTSVNKLPRACKPSTLKGCVRTLPDGYVHTYLLPQVHTCSPKFPLGRVSQQVGSAYLLTWEYQYWFLCYVGSLDLQYQVLESHCDLLIKSNNIFLSLV